MPPDFDKLPTPGNQEVSTEMFSDNNEVKDLLNIDDEKLNVNGGCIALGHPMGATGSIMMSTLIDELERQNLTTGIVATSGAAGAGTAI